MMSFRSGGKFFSASASTFLMADTDSRELASEFSVMAYCMAGTPSRRPTTASSLLPYSIRAISRRWSSCPLLFFKTILPNSSSVLSRPCSRAEYWNSCSSRDGRPPMVPTGAWMFCCLTAVEMSAAVSPFCAIFIGSSQIRRESSGPYSLTSDTPFTRFRASTNCVAP